jgi:hypothetical protein
VVSGDSDSAQHQDLAECGPRDCGVRENGRLPNDQPPARVSVWVTVVWTQRSIGLAWLCRSPLTRSHQPDRASGSETGSAPSRRGRLESRWRGPVGLGTQSLRAAWSSGPPSSSSVPPWHVLQVRLAGSGFRLVPSQTWRVGSGWAGLADRRIPVERKPWSVPSQEQAGRRSGRRADGTGGPTEQAGRRNRRAGGTGEPQVATLPRRERVQRDGDGLLLNLNTG